MVVKYTRDGDQNYKAQEADVTGTGSPLLIPGWVEEVSVAVILGTASAAKAQYTLDPENDVDANPAGADWIDWDAGDVSVDSGYPANSTVTAVRLVTTGGTATIKVAGKRKTVRVR